MSQAKQNQLASTSQPSLAMKSLFLGVALVLLLCVMALGCRLGLAKLRAMHAQHLALMMGSALNNGESSLRSFLENRQEQLRLLAGTTRAASLTAQALRERAEGRGADFEQTQRQLRLMFEPIMAHRATVGLALIDKDQINVFSQGLGPVGAVNVLAERGDRLLAVQTGQAGLIPLLSLPAFDGSQNYFQRLLVTAPVGGGADKPQAWLLLAIDPSTAFDQLPRPHFLGQSSQSYIFDWSGRRLGPGLAAEQPTAAGEMGATAKGWSLLAGQGGLGRSGINLDGYPSHKGETVVGAWRWDQDLNLGLAVELQAEEAFEAYGLARNMIWAGLAILGALCLLLWWRLGDQARRISGLNQDLARANQELSQEINQCQLAENRLQAGQQRYKSLFDNVHDLIFLFGLDGSGQHGPINQINQASSRLLGYDPAELTGQQPRRIIQPLQDFQAVLAKLNSQGRAVLETLLMGKNGELIPAEIDAQILRLDGQTMVMCLARDLSEQRRAQQEIREREARLKAMVEGFEGFIYICSEDFRLEFANSKLKEHLGRDPRGETCHKTIHGSASPCPWCVDGRVRHGMTHRREYLNPVDDRWYYSVTTPLVHPDGRVSHYGTMMDITERKLTEQRLADSEANYKAIFNAIDDAVFVHDPANGAILDVNPAATTMYGYSGQEMRQLDVAVLSDGKPPFSQAEALDKIGQALSGQPQRFEWLAKDKNGQRFWVDVTLKQAVLAGRPRLLAMVRDMSQRKKDEEQLLLAAKVFENSVEGITVTDRDGKIQMVNPGFSLITGYQPHEVLGQNPRILRSDRHDPEFYRLMWQEILEKGQWRGEIWNRRKNGEAYPEWLNISSIRDVHGQVTHYLAVFHDITEIKASQEQIKYQAYHDALTGLPNRALFNDRLRMALARSRRNRGNLAVLYLDLDHFKSVNDSLGHAVGDVLLQEVAARLSQVLRQDDTVARLGGDEFIMLMPDVEDADQVVSVAQRLLESMEPHFFLKGHELYVTASLGITLFPNDGENQETLIKNADMAMYRAKEQGRNNYQLYTPSMNKRVLLRQSLLGNLRKALDRDELVVYYQPKVELASGRVAGMEALVRWLRPDGQLLTPDKFIPLAEESGLIVPLGQQVLEKACRQSAAWASQGFSDLTVAVNLSARQFNQPRLLESVEDILAATGLPPARLELEITESTVMSNVQAAHQVLEFLHDMGISLALDDFGTGYSSLYYLKHLRIDVLKIDRSFVHDIPNNPDANAIAEAVVSLARSLRLKVVAEGVENSRQLEFLRGVNCDYMQGFLFSRPLEVEAFTALLREGRVLGF